MSHQDHEQLRANIWDEIYRSGPQSVDRLAEQLQLSSEEVGDLVDHAWFAVGEELVAIATSPAC